MSAVHHERTAEATSKLEVAVFDDPRFDDHHPGLGHPERPERIAAARRGVACAEVPLRPREGRDASDAELARVHTPGYLQTLRGLAGQTLHLDADTHVSSGSVPAAWRAAGTSCAMVDALVAGEARRAIALLRPPGHHARPGAAMGFCLLNNVAIAAAHARARGLSRVAIVDWDVHHGNGTQEAFERDPGVLFVSLHQAPLYPGSGEADEVGRGDGTGYTVNVPLSAEAGGDAYGAAFERIVLPIVDAYEPELILVSAGFDAHAGDPLGGMRLDAPAYARMTAALVELADAHAAGRIALLLEGGYRLDALEGALAASTRALLVRPEPTRSGTLDAAHEADLARAVATHRSRWKL